MRNMKKLSSEEEKELLDKCLHYFRYEDGKLFWRSPKKRATVGNEVGTVRPDGYRHLCLDQKYYLTHRIVWLMHNHQFPSKPLDHIDRDITNNRIENLREAEQWQNRGNSRGLLGKESGLPKGVHKTASGNFIAMFRNQGLGTYSTVAEAKRVYDERTKEYYGEFAYNG